MSDIEDLRYTAVMAALQAERAALEVELAEMEPRRRSLQDRIDQIDQAITTGVPIDPGYSYSRSPVSTHDMRTGGRFPTSSIEPDPAPAPGPEGHGRVPPPRPMRPRASASSPPRTIVPQSEQQPAMAGSVAMPVDPSQFGMGVGPDGDAPPRAPVVDSDDPAFLARMKQLANGDDDSWLDDPRYSPGPQHVDPYQRQIGE